MVVNYEQILDLIRGNFTKLMLKDSEYYANYEIVLSLEQQYVQNPKRKKGTIYLVCKPLEATIMYGITVMPFNIQVVAEENKIDVAQRLLLDYCETYTNKMDVNKGIKQFYTTPVSLSHFNEIGSGFRSLFSMSASFIIAPGLVDLPICEVYNETSEKYETLGIISYTPIFSNQLETQGFETINSRTRSVAKLGTFSFNLTMYEIKSDFVNKIRKVIYENEPINNTFKFKFSFNDYTTPEIECKLVEATSPYYYSELTIISLTFSR